MIAPHDITRHVSAAEGHCAPRPHFATLTHELRTPLNGILGAPGLLERGEPNEQTYVAAIKQSGELLLDLITGFPTTRASKRAASILNPHRFDPEGDDARRCRTDLTKAHSKGLDIAVTTQRCAAPRNGRRWSPAANLVQPRRQRREVHRQWRRDRGACAAPGAVGSRFNVRDTGPGVAPEKTSADFWNNSRKPTLASRAVTAARAWASPSSRSSRPRHGGSGPGFATGLQPQISGSSYRSLLRQRAAVFARGVPHCVLSRSAPVGASAARDRVSSALKALSDSGPADIILYDWRGASTPRKSTQLSAAPAPSLRLSRKKSAMRSRRVRAAIIEHYTLKPSAVVRSRSASRWRWAESGPHDGRTRETGRSAPLALTGLRVLLRTTHQRTALARTLLTRAGCVVTTAQDGEEAVAAAAATPYDLDFCSTSTYRASTAFQAAERIRARAGTIRCRPIICAFRRAR